MEKPMLNPIPNTDTSPRYASLVPSLKEVKMHHLKKFTDESLIDSDAGSEAGTNVDYECRQSDIEGGSEIKIPLRRATSETARPESCLEDGLPIYFTKLNLNEKDISSDLEQHVRRRVPHLDPNASDKNKMDNADQVPLATPPVEVAQEAIHSDLLRSGPTPQPPIQYEKISDVEKLIPDVTFNPVKTSVNSKHSKPKNLTMYRNQICISLIMLAATLLLPLPIFFLGLLWGVYLTLLILRVLFHVYIISRDEVDEECSGNPQSVIVSGEDLNLMKIEKTVYKGYMNLLRGHYDPAKYHINVTRTVQIYLDRDILRISIPKASELKRHTIWNEETHPEPEFKCQEYYNIAGATVCVRPKDLAPRRWWSRKYPICITFTKGAVISVLKRSHSDTALVISQQQRHHVNNVNDETTNHIRQTRPRFSHHESISDLPLNAEQDIEIDSINSAAKRKTIYLFGRSAREKEQWFHILRKASGQYSYKLKTSDRVAISESEMHSPELHKKALDWILYASLTKQFTKNMETVLPEQIEPKGLVTMDLGVFMWKPVTSITAEIAANRKNITWANAVATRIFMDFAKDPKWIDLIKQKIDHKLATIRLPYFIETLKMAKMELGSNTPKITGVYEPIVNEWGLWVDFNVEYSGGIHLVLETKLNLMNLKSNEAKLASREIDLLTTYSDQNEPDSPESSSDEDGQPELPFVNKAEKRDRYSCTRTRKSKGTKALHFLEKITNSKIFKKATEIKYVKRKMQGVSDTPINLIVDVIFAEGTVVVNFPAPPSDRLWYGFRCPPKLVLKARPKVGNSALNLTMVSDWIEAKLCFLLEKFLVVPNMDDFIIPLMSGSPLFRDINK